MASGSSSSNRIGSGSRSFDFGSDDVLCSYDDVVGLDAPNGKRPDSAGAGGKDFREGRTGRPLQNLYCQQEGYNKQDMIFAVEKCMKKYADNLLSVLEGISGRLKHLEVYCYSLEKSVGDFRSDLAHDQSETDLKLKSLEKHLQEVHRSVQILRDKQELSETQKELAKLQLSQKESSAPSATEQQKKDDADASNKQLVLALPQQPVVQPPTLAARAPEPQNPASQPVVPSSLPVQQPSYLAQGGSFYSQQPAQVLNQPPQLQPVAQPQPQPQPQLVPQPHPQPVSQPEARYTPQIPRSQDLPVQTPPQQTHAMNQSQAPYPGYTQQWPQQAPQQFPQPVSQPQQQAPTPAQYPQGPPAYPPYQPPQPVKAPGESFQGSMPVSYSPIPPPGSNPHDIAPYGYGGPAGSMPQQPPPTHSMQRPTQPPSSQTSPGSQLSKGGYTSPAPPYPPHPPAQGYSSYGADGGGRPAHSQPMYGGGYPPSSISGPQNQLPPPSAARGHPFGELMEKAVNMGYPRDLVAGALYRMEETGQPANFNMLLDMLNGRASSPAQRGWSG